MLFLPLPKYAAIMIQLVLINGKAESENTQKHYGFISAASMIGFQASINIIIISIF